MLAAEERLLQEVDGLEGEIVELASRLVAEPSTLGNEAGALEVMERAWRELGLGPRRVPVEPDELAGHPGFAPVPWSYEGRYNLAAVRPADGEGGKSALLNGHLDVVSPEPLRLWETDPFEPKVADGWLYGRGAGDMKAGVAAMTFALAAVDRAGLGLRAPVTLEAVIEEECSGMGAVACLAAGYDAEAALIPEPFGPTLYTHQVGVLVFKVSLAGTPSHVLDTQAGVNAVEKCFPLIQALRELEKRENAKPRPGAYQGLAHPLNLNVGIFRGGDWPSTVPAEAEMHCRFAYLPGESFAEAAGRVEEAVARAAAADPWLAANPPRVEFYGHRRDGHVLDSGQPVHRALARCHRELTGAEPAEYISTCTTDTGALTLYGGGQATCYGPRAENIHAANERVEIASVMHTARAYALFLARWCGLAG
jgi:acetylornithine deacetylase